MVHRDVHWYLIPETQQIHNKVHKGARHQFQQWLLRNRICSVNCTGSCSRYMQCTLWNYECTPNHHWEWRRTLHTRLCSTVACCQNRQLPLWWKSPWAFANRARLWDDSESYKNLLALVVVRVSHDGPHFSLSSFIVNSTYVYLHFNLSCIIHMQLPLFIISLICTVC